MGAFAGPRQQRINFDLNANNSVSFSLNNFPNADNYKIKVDGFLGISTTRNVGIVTVSPGLTRNISIEAYSGLNLLFTANKNIKIFDYVGIAQSWTTPANVKYLFADVQGAQGGGSGGAGGRAKSYISVASSEILYFYCGGAGGNAFSIGCTSIAPNFVTGGFNGGGRGGGTSDAYNCGIGLTTYGRGASGGGASDIRRGLDNLSTRIIVAGGGGGGPTGGAEGGGGKGGGEDGTDGGYSIGGSWPTSLRGKGGTISSFGLGGTGGSVQGQNGTIGIGGSGAVIGVYGDNPGRSGGGGGGYFGGGGGAVGSNYAAHGGGGGGSGYIDVGFKSLISSSGFGSITSGYRSGNGRIMIAWDSITPYSDIVTSGLVLNLDAQNYYSYPGSGTTWTDLSGFGRNGTINGSPTFTNGYFDITSDSTYISLSNSGLVPRTNDFTYSTWINFDATDALDTIFENGSWTDTLLFRYQTNSVAVYAEDSLRGSFSWTATAGVWYNVVFKRESGTCSMYINNTLTGTPFTMTTDINLTNTNLFLMRSQHTTGQFLDGKISTFSIYNRALTASEIQQNYNATKSRFGL